MRLHAVLLLLPFLLSSSSASSVAASAAVPSWFTGRKPTQTSSSVVIQGNDGAMVPSSASVVPESSSVITLTQKIRGGGTSAVPLNPVTLAKVVTILSGAQGLMMNVAPNKVIQQLYGKTEELEEKNNKSVLLCEWMARQCGTGILAYAVSVYLLVMDKVSLQQAVQLSNVMFLYEYLRFLLNDGPKAVGFSSNIMHYLAIVLMGNTVFAMTRAYATTYLPVICVFWGVFGGIMIVAPSSALELWFYGGGPLDDKSRRMVKSFGYYLVAKAVLQGSMAIGSVGATPLEAFGYSSIVWLLHHVEGIISGGDDKSPSNDQTSIRNARLFWIFMNALTIITTLL